MLNEKEILKAIELFNNGKKTRDIAQELNTALPEITYSLNSYKILNEIYSNKLEAIKNKVTNIDNKSVIDASEALEKEKELKEWEYKLLEKEAIIKLFTKRTIYKYRVKDQNLNKRYEKFVLSFKDEIKTLKEEHFACWANLQKEIKEKIHAKEELEKYKYNTKWNKLTFFISGIIPGVIITLLIFKFLGVANG